VYQGAEVVLVAGGVAGKTGSPEVFFGDDPLAGNKDCGRVARGAAPVSGK